MVDRDRFGQSIELDGKREKNPPANVRFMSPFTKTSRLEVRTKLLAILVVRTGRRVGVV